MEGGTAISRRRAPCLPAVCGCAWVIKKQKTNQKNKKTKPKKQRSKPNRPKNQTKQAKKPKSQCNILGYGANFKHEVCFDGPELQF